MPNDTGTTATPFAGDITPNNSDISSSGSNGNSSDANGNSSDANGNSSNAYTFPSMILSPSPGTLVNGGALGNYTFDQYTIKLKVTLYHNGEKYDLTPYIMQVKTHMALGEPSGQFTLLLTFQKRWDLFIQPQDYVEIRFSRYLPDPPIAMRGLVSNVRRTRVMDDSGKMHRAITVNGENYGKLWREYQIQYLVAQPGQTNTSGIDTDPAVGLFFPMLTENFGIGSTQNDVPVAPADLMQGITDKMLNAQVTAMQQVNPQMPLLTCIAKVLPDYLLNYLQIQQSQGTAYTLIQQYGNAPWCEWFIDEAARGPVFFYRNTPFKSQDGSYVFPESEPDANYFFHPHISDADLIEEDVGHTDAETYSYFFTYPSTSLIDQIAWKAYIIGREQLTQSTEADSQNITDPHVETENLYRFGFQMLQIGSPAISTTESDQGQALSTKMNGWLVNAFKWAPQMLNGTLRIKGNEHMRIGRYMTNDSTKEEYYIESVDHEINIAQTGSMGNDNVYSFTTTVGITRGRRL